MRALLVEDDQTIADFVARGLREAGFTVDRAADGEDGLHDVVLCQSIARAHAGAGSVAELPAVGAPA